MEIIRLYRDKTISLFCKKKLEGSKRMSKKTVFLVSGLNHSWDFCWQDVESKMEWSSWQGAPGTSGMSVPTRELGTPGLSCLLTVWFCCGEQSWDWVFTNLWQDRVTNFPTYHVAKHHSLLLMGHGYGVLKLQGLYLCLENHMAGGSRGVYEAKSVII